MKNSTFVRSLVLVVGWILCIAACEKNPVFPEDLETLIRSFVDTDHIPSIAACILKDDRIVWQYAYGYADRENEIPATDETIYILASISKPVTATAVMQFVEQGLIDLDEDISNYLPFRVRHPRYPDIVITTRMVLAHRSGLGWPALPESSFYVTYTGEEPPPFFPWIREFMLPDGSDYNPSIWRPTAPGEQYWYSNFGFTLLGYLVEEASGKNFKEYCRENIFLPLDMHDTSFRIGDLDADRLALPYDDNETPRGHITYIYYPAGALRSSIRDFSRFMIVMMNGGACDGRRILRESSVREMLTRHYPDNEVGLAWKIPGGGWYEHSGSLDGARTQSEFHEADNVGILVFSNGESETVQRDGMVYYHIKQEAETYR